MFWTRLEEARVAFQKAVQLNPDDTRARHYLTEVERLLQGPAK
jgi:predicted RNA polymerase sigma factor